MSLNLTALPALKFDPIQKAQPMSEPTITHDSRQKCICFLAAYSIVVQGLDEKVALKDARYVVDQTPNDRTANISDSLGVLATFVPGATLSPEQDIKILQVGTALLART